MNDPYYEHDLHYMSLGELAREAIRRCSRELTWTDNDTERVNAVICAAARQTLETWLLAGYPLYQALEPFVLPPPPESELTPGVDDMDDDVPF